MPLDNLDAFLGNLQEAPATAGYELLCCGRLLVKAIRQRCLEITEALQKETGHLRFYTDDKGFGGFYAITRVEIEARN